MGSAPALGSSSALAVESPTAAKTAAARSLFDSRAIPATAAAETPTTLAASVPPSMSHLPNPAKEGSLRGGNLFHSIAQGTWRSNRWLVGSKSAGQGFERRAGGSIVD